MRDWLKARALLCFLLSLCVLTVSFVFVPGLSKFNESFAPPSSAPPEGQSYALLAATFNINANLQRVPRMESGAYRRALLIRAAVAPSQTQRCFSQEPRLISNCPGSFAGISRTQYHQACQLLDLPPPASMVSL
ncbi:MAG: hypothetical protein Q8O05_07065 [Chloroflexota bacterium]|nr:hypothetical protein [Chloroflexota bacterium]